MLRQNEGAVRLDFDDRETLVAESRNPLPVGEIPPGGLNAALDQVPGHNPARDPVPVVGIPAEGVPNGGERDSGIRDAPGDDHIRPVRERPDNRLGAEVGVRRQNIGATGGERVAGLQVVEADAVSCQVVEPAHQVIPVDHRDRQLDSGLGR